MQIFGIDFTSAPRPRKPITVASAQLQATDFWYEGMQEIATLAEFERWLARDTSWIGGFDFPFGLPRTAVVALGWPTRWPQLVRHCEMLGRENLRTALNTYRHTRPVGDKYPYRRGDAAAGAHSPIKLVNPPVALMFLEGASRLLAAGVHVPGLQRGDPRRIAVEAYPGYAVRRLLGSRARVSYKNDARSKQTSEQLRMRGNILRALTSRESFFGLRVRLDRRQRSELVADGSGDRLDALVCALQAGWSWRRRACNFGLPAETDPLEGWIATVPAG
jgi:hypothetical protein